MADFEIKNAQKIIGTRNRITHEYDNISDEIIWTIIIRELPKLKVEILEIKNRFSQWNALAFTNTELTKQKRHK